MSVRGTIIDTLKARLSAMAVAGVTVGIIDEQGWSDDEAERSQVLAADRAVVELFTADDEPDGAEETSVVEEVRFDVVVVVKLPKNKVDAGNTHATAQAWHEKVYACYSSATDPTWETFGGLATEAVHEGGGAPYIAADGMFAVTTMFTIRYRFKRGNLSQSHP